MTVPSHKGNSNFGGNSFRFTSAGSPLSRFSWRPSSPQETLPVDVIYANETNKTSDWTLDRLLSTLEFTRSDGTEVTDADLSSQLRLIVRGLRMLQIQQVYQELPWRLQQCHNIKHQIKQKLKLTIQSTQDNQLHSPHVQYPQHFEKLEKLENPEKLKKDGNVENPVTTPFANTSNSINTINTINATNTSNISNISNFSHSSSTRSTSNVSSMPRNASMPNILHNANNPNITSSAQIGKESFRSRSINDARSDGARASLLSGVSDEFEGASLNSSFASPGANFASFDQNDTWNNYHNHSKNCSNCPNSSSNSSNCSRSRQSSQSSHSSHSSCNTSCNTSCNGSNQSSPRCGAEALDCGAHGAKYRIMVITDKTDVWDKWEKWDKMDSNEFGDGFDRMDKYPDASDNFFIFGSGSLQGSSSLTSHSSLRSLTLAGFENHLSLNTRALPLTMTTLPFEVTALIAEYELSDPHCVQTFVRSVLHNYISRFYLVSWLSGWCVVTVGVYLFLSSIGAISRLKYITSLSHGHATWHPTPWYVDTIVGLFFGLLHVFCCLWSFVKARQKHKKVEKIKRCLRMKNFKNCGEVYIPVLRWLHFPWAECVNIPWKWFLLLGFKYLVMAVLFTLLSLPNIVIMHSAWTVMTPCAAVLCWLGGWLHLLAFHDRNSRQACYDLVKLAFMVTIVFGIIIGIAWIALTDSSDIYTSLDLVGALDLNNVHKNVKNVALTKMYLYPGSSNGFDAVLGSLFAACLVCIELRVAYLWKSVKVRYHYFAIQLIASINLGIIFSIFSVTLGLLLSLGLVLYNTSVLWNDMMHKRLMQMSPAEYVKRYRPVRTSAGSCCQCFGSRATLVETENQMDAPPQPQGILLQAAQERDDDEDEEHLEEQTKRGFVGGWICQIYGGLLLGRISNPEYSIHCDRNV